jgi:hypothetical protein
VVRFVDDDHVPAGGNRLFDARSLFAEEAGSHNSS